MRKGSASSMPTRTSTTRMARAPDMPIAAQRSHEGKYAPNKWSDGAHPPTPSIRGAGAARMRKGALGTTHARIAIDRMPPMDPFAHLAASAVRGLAFAAERPDVGASVELIADFAGGSIAKRRSRSGLAAWVGTLSGSPCKPALLPGRIGDSCPDQCVDIGIMLSFRWVMIQMEPPMTRKTISTPKARAKILFV
jgi:hypothetical protein